MGSDMPVVVITGGAGGIGQETARLLGTDGYRIVIADYNSATGSITENKLKERGIEARFIQVDLLEQKNIRGLFSNIIDGYNKIDILVNCAGVSSLTGIPDITFEEWDTVLNINLRASFFCAQEALKYMVPKKSGRIINVASAAGKIGGVAVGAHYSASKAAIICLTKSLALFGASYNINVNCVCPGPVKTAMTDEWGVELNKSFVEKIPLKRYGKPEEVAEVISFLSSDKAEYITGETVDVNGGLVMD